MFHFVKMYEQPLFFLGENFFLPRHNLAPLVSFVALFFDNVLLNMSKKDILGPARPPAHFELFWLRGGALKVSQAQWWTVVLRVPRMYRGEGLPLA